MWLYFCNYTERFSILQSVNTDKAANNNFLLLSTDVAEGDPDADCRSLAVQSLVLLDKSLKKQLQDPLSLESWS